MLQAIATHNATTAQILHPDTVILRLDQLRRELEVSVAAIMEIYGDQPYACDTPEWEGVCDAAGSYETLIHDLGESILDICPCSIETLTIQAMLIDARPAAERTEWHSDTFTHDAAHVLARSRRLATVRRWGK
jgi:hypothetical protein